MLDQFYKLQLYRIQGGLHIWHKEVQQLQPQPAEATAGETKELSHGECLPG